jgi:hypothetical protein
MNWPKTMMKKVAKILLSEGATSLLVRSTKSLNFRIRNRLQEAAYSEIDRIAKSNISNSEKFSLIYRKKLWLKAVPHLNPEKTLSGHGSTQSSTRVFRRSLEHFLHEMNVEKFFDAPCGDFNWMKDVNVPDHCDYIGGDIVPALVANLQLKYGRISGPGEASSRQFINFDLIVDSFPSADVWLCKDCFQHLSNSDIRLVLNNFRRSRVKTALISNHIGVSFNVDIETGQFRHIDLTRAPFNLPPARQTLPDAPVDGEPRYIGVWRREDLC